MMRALHTILAGMIAVSCASSPDKPKDTDSDGVPDTRDNCIEVHNPHQIDSDGDWYGNACDIDFNNDGIVAPWEYFRWSTYYDTSQLDGDWWPDADLTEDGVVGGPDYGRAVEQLNSGEPGPSGLRD